MKADDPGVHIRWATKSALLDVIRRIVAQYSDRQDIAAQQLGVSAQYLCDVLKGRREPGAKLLKAIGYRRVTIYEQVAKELR